MKDDAQRRFAESDRRGRCGGRCPGGENPAQVTERADRLIRRLTTLQGYVALFSHAQFGSALAARWIGWSSFLGDRFILDPESVSILGHEQYHVEVRAIVLWKRVAAS